MEQINSLPALHKEFVETSVEKLKEDKRILGVAAGGSFVLGTMDEYSDLDLVVAIDPEKYEEVMQTGKTIAAGIGELLECFTGEHVGEPRLLICLYGPPLLHVDLKFVSVNNLQNRVEHPIVLWERDSVFSKSANETEAKFPEPNLDWIENRFWIWTHYTAGKIGRGELFEAIDAINFLRGNVLGPMALLLSGARPQGVRRLEDNCGRYLDSFKQTIPLHKRKSCFKALQVSIELYEELRDELTDKYHLHPNNNVIEEVKKYLNKIEVLVEDE